MGKQVFNVMRLMRIQLKSGYVKVEPEAYTFMKRYPPLTRDSAKVIRKVEVTTIPYLRLYEDALAKNPKFIDERVYPAYWQQEPVAMTLAKKQYEMMRKGLTEEEAYEEALAYTETLESKAYEEMKIVIDMSGNADALKPLENDPAFVKTMKVYSTILSEVDYEDLEDHDQGELDHMLQTKVLKWSEIERERRMKDPVFAIEFERLRKAMFPIQSKVSMLRKPEKRLDSMEVLMDLYQVDETKLCTNEPFYYDDYMFLFEKAKEEPLLGRWSVRDRQELSRWITDTLALREIVEKRETGVVQRYLDDLRAQFFPMVRYPDRAYSFSLPDMGESLLLLLLLLLLSIPLDHCDILL